MNIQNSDKSPPLLPLTLPLLKRSHSAHNLGRADVYVRPAIYNRSIVKLVPHNLYVEIDQACKKAKPLMGLDLRQGAQTGSTVMQLIGMALTATGIGLAVWPMIGLGLGTMLLCVAMFATYYGIQRIGNRADRRVKVAELEVLMKRLQASLNDPKAQATATPNDWAKAEELKTELERTLTHLRGGWWFAAKQIFYGTFVGSVVLFMGKVESVWCGLRGTKNQTV